MLPFSKLNIHKGHIKQHLNGVQLTMQILTCITILFHNHQTMTSVTTKIHCAPILMIHVAPDIKCHTYIFLFNINKYFLLVVEVFKFQKVLGIFID